MTIGFSVCTVSTSAFSATPVPGRLRQRLQRVHRSPGGAGFSAGVRPGTWVPCLERGIQDRQGVPWRRRGRRHVSARTWSGRRAAAAAPGATEVETCSSRRAPRRSSALRSAGLRWIAPNIVAIFPNSSRVHLRDRRHRTHELVQGCRRSRMSSVLGSDIARHWLEVTEQRRQAREHLIERRPARGQRVAEPDEIVLDRPPRLGVEDLEHVVELDRDVRSASRARWRRPRSRCQDTPLWRWRIEPRCRARLDRSWSSRSAPCRYDFSSFSVSCAPVRPFFHSSPASATTPGRSEVPLARRCPRPARIRSRCPP